jgi:multiple sugar transport system permease protein
MEIQNKRLKSGFSKYRMMGKAENLLCHLILFGISFMILFPLLKKGLTMVKGTEDLLDPTTVYIPKFPTIDTIQLSIQGMNYWNALKNTVLMALGVALITVAASTFIAYGFARFHFRGRNLLFVFVIIALLIPPQILMNSYYMMFRYFDIFGILKLITGKTVNLLDSFVPFAILSALGFGLKNSLYIFLERQYFRNMPMEMEEAGFIDGAGPFSIFFRIMLPNAKPILVTVFLFSFSWQWTDNYYTSLFLQDFLVLPNALASLQTFKMTELEPVLRTALVDSGIVLTIIPLIFVYLIGQKFFIQGVSRSGIVG